MRKYFCNITFLLGLTIFAGTLVTACSPKSEKTEFNDLRKTQFTYEPRNQDKEILSTSANQFRIQSVLGIEKAKSQQTAIANNSVEIFRLAEETLELGDMRSGLERTQYKKFGHDLLRLFYQAKGNATQFDKDHTMYLPGALGFEGEKIKALFLGIATAENLNGVKNTFNSHHIVWPATQPTLRPIEFIKSIKAYLLAVVPIFEKNGVSKAFIKTFSDQLRKDYLQALDNAEVSLANIGPGQKLKVNARTITDVIKTLSFIPKEALDSLEGNLVKAKLYSELIERKHSTGTAHAPRLVQVIASIWLDLTPPQREKYIKPANVMLYNSLNDFSEKMLSWLAGRTELSATDAEFYMGWVMKPKFIGKLNVSCHPDIYNKLVAWTKFDQNQKAGFRTEQPNLFNIFSRYSNEEIKADLLSIYSGDQFDVPLTDITNTPGKKFVAEVETVCLDGIQAILDSSINTYLLTELDIQIRNWGSMIEKVCAEKTIKNLEDLTVATNSNEKFKEFFDKMASPVMENLLFSTGPINGIENSKVQLFVDAENQFSTKRTNLGEFETGAEVLGTSLAAQYRRILGLPEFEKKAVNSKGYYREVFSQINKMLSMIGFRTIDHKLAPSLHRKFYGTMNELDVYKYECSSKKVEAQKIRKERYAGAVARNEKPSPDDFVDRREDCEGYEGYISTLFAIPDQLKINGAFIPGEGIRKSSIRGQSEIIRGAAFMLQYFSDWRGPNDFDAGMGKETSHDISIFPKSALVNLAVAAMTTPIRSLQKENSPLKLFNMMGSEIEGWAKNGIPDPSQKDSSTPQDPNQQIIQAAVVDLLGAGPSKTVRTEDLAYFIVAVDEFLKATDGIEQTQASVINPPQKTVKENMEAILKGRRLLKMMMFAMSNFAVTRLQDKDGGFWTEYDLDSKQVKKSDRSLEVQLAVIDALLRVYQQWGSEAALVASAESYYFMNQKLWSEETSFYRADESLLSTEVKPYLYLKAVKNFSKIEPYLNNSNSALQAKTLFDYYSKEFLKWNQSSKPMSTQLN